MKISRTAASPQASVLFGGSCHHHLPVCKLNWPLAPLPSLSLNGRLKGGFLRNKRNLVRHKGSVPVRVEPGNFPCIQTLRTFPKEELLDKVALVRFDSTILLREAQDQGTASYSNALLTIRYLLEAGAKVILVSDWNRKINSKLHVLKSVADYLSSVLGVNVVSERHHCLDLSPNAKAFEKKDVLLLPNLSQLKEDLSNSAEFAETLSSGVDVFVNDSFSQSHKILASTVGVASFCYACVAGFHFEESLKKLSKALASSKKPYIAIIGGANLSEKHAALHHLASGCDGLVFVGMMAFQIMHALKLPVPLNFLEKNAFEEASKLVQTAQCRKIPILCPKDFWCINDDWPHHLKVYSVETIPEGDIVVSQVSDVPLDLLQQLIGEVVLRQRDDEMVVVKVIGWLPADLGPRSLDEINLLLNSCKKIIWIGPVRFKLPTPSNYGETKLIQFLDKLCESGCDVTVVGSAKCETMMKKSNSSATYSLIENASVFWEFLKGRKLPGVMALDRAYPFKIDWNFVYKKPSQPLAIDIGSGTLIFMPSSNMADFDFQLLDHLLKLVKRCLHCAHQYGLKNGYFIATNATSTFRSIVSTYPGQVVLVSIQCPNPDFSDPDHRWRMLQRSLVEAIVDLLAYNGKVFLQSDVEAVVVRMKDLFLKLGKGKLELVQCQDATNFGIWLKENPFGLRSDWERHVLDRGAPMYRLMLRKAEHHELGAKVLLERPTEFQAFF